VRDLVHEYMAKILDHVKIRLILGKQNIQMFKKEIERCKDRIYNPLKFGDEQIYGEMSKLYIIQDKESKSIT
jgi:hypothetical protein